MFTEGMRGHETREPKRQANDGLCYTRAEFVQHFGDAIGPKNSENAGAEDPGGSLQRAGAEEPGSASSSVSALDPASVVEAQHAPTAFLTAKPREDAGAEERRVDGLCTYTYADFVESRRHIRNSDRTDEEKVR